MQQRAVVPERNLTGFLEPSIAADVGQEKPHISNLILWQALLKLAEGFMRMIEGDQIPAA